MEATAQVASIAQCIASATEDGIERTGKYATSSASAETASDCQASNLAEFEIESIEGDAEMPLSHSEFLLTPEVLAYEPSAVDVFQRRENEEEDGDEEDGVRLIFTGAKLTKRESSSLVALRGVLNDMKHVDGPQALRILQQCKFDVEASATMLREQVEFAKLHASPSLLPSIMEDLASGFIYWHGRDRHCRPCLFIRLERCEAFVNDSDRAQELVSFVLEYAVRYALVPGRVENWVIVLDLENALSLVSSPFQVPGVISTAMGLADVLENRFCGRMGWIKLVNMPGGFMLNRLVNGAIPEEKKDCVSCPDDVAAELAEHFEPHQLEMRYGGTAPDVEPGSVFPFRFFPNATSGDTAVKPEVTSVEEESIVARTYSDCGFREG